MGKGAPKPRNEELKQLNSYLEEIRSKMFSHHQDLNLAGETITAEAVKNAYLGIAPEDEKGQMTLRQLVEAHKDQMKTAVKPGTMKNYFSTAFEYYIRTTPIKSESPCTNNAPKYTLVF